MDEKTALLYEQLCCAAKAFGRGLLVEGFYPEPFCLAIQDGKGGTYRWAPHDDDGDSRCLEVDLNIEVRFHLAGPVPAVTATCAADSRIPVMREPWGDDKHAATRLAVLRAAAAIGEKMP